MSDTMYYPGGSNNYNGRNNNMRCDSQQNYVHHGNARKSPRDTSNLLGSSGNAYNQSGYDSKVNGYQGGRGGNNYNYNDDSNMINSRNNDAKNYNRFKKINDSKANKTPRQHRRDRQKQRKVRAQPQFGKKSRGRSHKNSYNKNTQNSEIRQENITKAADTTVATNIPKEATPPPLLSIKLEKIKQENKVKEMATISVKQEKSLTTEKLNTTLELQKKNESSSDSSDSSSSSSEETPVKDKVQKNVINPEPETQAEDVVCLGHVENKFSIDDEDNDNKEESEEELEEAAVKNTTMNESNQKEICVLCDKIGHTSFQCQMICKNCSGSYHNLKTCPKPPNLSIMLQSFMEFCTLQIGFFNPELKFGFNQHTNYNVASTEQSNSDKKSKRKSSQKDTLKKLKSKRKMKNSEKSEQSSTNSTSSDGSSTSSESEVGSTKSSKKHKRRRLKNNSISTSETAAYTANPFMAHAGLPQFPLPGFSPAAAYNPTLFSQMLHSAFPGHGQLNFNK
ncbi:protein mushroom body miniature [Teleopsis dalmanni]|uniref:protein mushroom body miniature n=1 Tax=Teleopsis dalmanni TaxID=139649 RepID=UPI000D329C84|nr:protein mushroom body miniature [Teleopsis dalmanni]